MEVKTADVDEALRILKREFIQSTGLIHHDLSTVDAIFDENAATTVCPACGTTFIPNSTKTCPDCGLCFG